METTTSNKGFMEDKDKESGAVDSRTIFVRNLPYTLTDAQLQEVFSEIGPVRRSFTVKEKGTEQHRGFGFVQYAVMEDAIRAVEGKHESNLQGRKIKVELAKHRTPFEQRRSRKHGDDGSIMHLPVSSGTCLEEERIAQKMPHGLDQSKKRKLCDQKAIQSEEIGTEAQRGKKPRHDLSFVQELPKKLKEGHEYKEGKSSERQRVARTVIFGGLISPEMCEEMIDCAKKSGSVESVQSSLSLEELKGRGLEKDGCKMGAAAVIYTSVRAASLAVATLHQKSIGGGTVWARQLGGEGSKPRKWTVIVRNLPFKVTEKEVRELFSSAGFVWKITIPHTADGRCKGFAFASFTGNADAEKAINIANGKSVGGRPVAVDWAVARNLHEKNSGMTQEKPEDVQKTVLSEIEDEETASEGEEDDLIQERDHKPMVSDTSVAANLLMDRQRKQKETYRQSNKENSDRDCSTVCANKKQPCQDEKTLQYDEMDLARRVLKKVASASFGEGQGNNKPKETEGEPQSSKDDNTFAEEQSRPELGSEDVERFRKTAGKLQVAQGGDMKKTIFVNNLPFEADVDGLKKLFLAFGKVKSVHLVQHPQTKRPKGTAFLEYLTEEAATAAVTAGAENGGNVVDGIMHGGRHLGVFLALDKKSAQALEKKRLEKDTLDRRNLYLAKEGKVEEGTAAADGVSEKDLQKRKQLEQEKATKLQSPNFHVSRTRLAIYNVPNIMREADLRNLFVDAVKSRATKQQPIIKQVKILRDEKKAGKSRGVAFIEFSEHQHALVALRVLNNNPETFSSERRPIVEFAIENLQTLKKRKERQTGADASVNNEARKHISLKNEKRPSRLYKRGRSEMNNCSDKEDAGKLPYPERTESRRQTAQKDYSGLENGKRLNKVTRKNLMKKTKSELSGDGDGEQISSTGDKSKRQLKEKELSGFQNKSSVNNAIRHPRNKESSIKNPSLKIQKSTFKKINGADRRAMSEDRKIPFLGGDKQSTVLNKKMDLRNQETDFRMTILGKQRKDQPRKRNSKPEIEDKLDKLVADYRKKYFSDGSRGPKGNMELSNSKATIDLKRWFE